MKTISNKAIREAVSALLEAKELAKRADALKSEAKAQILLQLEKAGLPVNEISRQAKAMVSGVEVTASFVSGRTGIDADGLRHRYPRIAKQFTKQGRPYVKVDSRVIEAERAAELRVA